MLLVEELPPEKKRIPKPLYLLPVLILTGIAVFVNIAATPHTVISPLPDSPTFFTSIRNLFRPKKNPDTLERIIRDTVRNTWHNYSVLVVDYKSDFRMGIGDGVMFTAASVNKIPIMAALYYLHQKGDVDMDRIVTLQASDVQDYGTGIIRYDPPGTTYSVKTLARLMMEKSDNTAAYILAQYIIGYDTLTKLVRDWGLNQTDMNSNKTSNRDMEILMRKIMNGYIANTADTEEMLSIMKDSDFEDRLPVLIPKTAAVYHKIGSEVGNLHDVGIVADSKHRYYIGIFTGDVVNETETVALMGKISKIVYDYLE